jgi:hypothetical protein
VPASLPWHCRGNINCDHWKDWKKWWGHTDFNISI